jgi:hypothetical protein
LLPDFTATKKEIKRIVTERLRRGVYQEAAFLSRLRRSKSHEGDSFTIHRLDGSTQTNRYREIAVELAIDKKDLATLTPKALAEKIDKAAVEMAEKTSRGFFEKLHQVTSESGRVHDAKGKPISSETLLEALEMIDIDFDEKGEPSGLTVVVGPELWERIKQKVPEWEADPEFKRRHGELMQRKREAWRDRESRRKLVD